MTRSRTWPIAMAVAGAFVALAIAEPVAQSRPRTVYVSVSDKDGAPIKDMQPADFEVKEGGKTCQIASAKPSTAPLRIAVVVSDLGSGAFQPSLGRFMQKLLGHAEFALYSVIVQPERVVEYSEDATALSAGLRRLGPRGQERGAQLMEAIRDVTKDIRSETKRPIIVVMRAGAEGTTTLTGDAVRDQLRRSGAALYVVSTRGAERPAPSQITGTDDVSIQQGRLRDDEQKDSTFALAQVLGDGAKDSGGRHVQVISTTLIATMEQLADELLNQYEVSYVLPEGAKPSDRLAVSSKRKGVTLRAPSRLPN